MSKHDKSAGVEQGLMDGGRERVVASSGPKACEALNEVVVVVDYHKKNLEFRVHNRLTGKERTFNRETSRKTVLGVLEMVSQEAGGQGGRVVWIMESTTGWARVKKLVEGKCEFLLVNVLQLPLAPAAHKRKTDKMDTGRVMREYLKGDLKCAHQPELELRQVRRMVGLREDLVKRRTALRNRVNAMISHETWHATANLWEGPGRVRMKAIMRELGESDVFVLGMMLKEHDEVEEHVLEVEKRLMGIYEQSAAAQGLDAIKGIGPVGAVSIVARIGPVERFGDAQELVAFAGLAPGIRSWDGTLRNLRIGGGGTDKHLRHYLIEATVWARKIPRYKEAYEKMVARKGRKIGRIVVARMLVRSIYKMLHDGVEFDPAA